MLLSKLAAHLRPVRTDADADGLAIEPSLLPAVRSHPTLGDGLATNLHGNGEHELLCTHHTVHSRHSTRAESRRSLDV